MVPPFRSIVGPTGYVVVSYLLLFLYLGDCLNTYREFYPFVIYLSNSAVFQVIAVNAFLATAVALWKGTQWFFFGQLSSGEAAAIATAGSLYISDCVIALLYSEQQLLSRYCAAYILITVWQVLHRVARERLSLVGTLPLPVRRRKVLGLLCFGVFSITVNTGLVLTLVCSLSGETSKKRLLARYTLVITLTQTLFTTLLVISLLAFGAWRSGDLSHRAFFIKAFWHYVSAVTFIASFFYVCAMADAPFMLVRTLLRELFSAWETTVQLVRYVSLSRVTGRLPTAVAADLEGEARCSICYEDMLPDGKARRLSCGHCYHNECLQQWCQSNSTCPYCRADMFKPAPRAAAAAAAEARDAVAPAEGVGLVPPPADVPHVEAMAAEDKRERKKVRTRREPRGGLTGEPELDEAMLDVLKASKGAREAEMAAAYRRYVRTMRRKADGVPPEERQQLTALEKSTDRASLRDARWEPPVPKEPRFERPSGSDVQEGEGDAESGGGDGGGVPPLATAHPRDGFSLPPNFPHPAAGAAAAASSPSTTTPAGPEAKAAARLRAFEEYQAEIRRAEWEFRRRLASIDAEKNE